MSNTLLALLFNTGLVILLIATISYCAKLSRRIKMLQDGRSEFSTMISMFDTATDRAAASVNELQTVSKKITEALQLKIDKANFLADDLAFLIEKSNKLVLQLEQLKLDSEEKALLRKVESARSHEAKARPSMENVLQILSEADSMPLQDKLVPRTSAERELLAALKSSR